MRKSVLIGVAVAVVLALLALSQLAIGGLGK